MKCWWIFGHCYHRKGVEYKRFKPSRCVRHPRQSEGTFRDEECCKCAKVRSYRVMEYYYY